MNKEESEQMIEQLQNQLAQRGNHLINQDPLCQRIVGQIEVYQTIYSPDNPIELNGEIIEENKK